MVCSIHFFTCYMPACVSRTCAYILHASRVVRQNGRMALMRAAENGHTDTVQLLLEHGADVNFVHVDDDDVSAACVRCVLDIVTWHTPRVLCGRTGTRR